MRALGVLPRASIALLGAVALILVTLPVTAQPGAPLDRPLRPHVDGVVLVGFRPGASATARGRAVASVNATKTSPVSLLAEDTVLVKLPPGLSVEEAIVRLQGEPYELRRRMVQLCMGMVDWSDGFPEDEVGAAAYITRNLIEQE